MSKTTIIEELFFRAVNNNTVFIPVKDCSVVSLAGPLRLSNENPEAMVNLALNALAGEARKEIQQNILPTPIANLTLTFTAAIRMVAVLVTVTGNISTIKKAPVRLDISGTRLTTTEFAIYPFTDHCQALVLCTTDNGGVGQISAAEAVTLNFVTAENPGHVAAEYSIAAETITMRDFTSRARQ